MPIPKWTEITAANEWNQITPQQQEDIRLKWIQNVLAENPNWEADKIRELEAITRQHQPEGQPQPPQQQQPPPIQPDVTADGNLDLTATAFPKQTDPIMQEALPPDGSVAPTQAIEQPTPPAQEQRDPLEIHNFLEDTGKIARGVFETTPFYSVMKGYEEGGIGGAIGRALGYPWRVGRELIEDFTKRDAFMKTIGFLNAGQAGMVEGIKDKRMQLSDTNWHEQPYEDRILDIKETIKNEGMRHTFGDAVLIPLGFSLPDRLRDIILNQDASGRTPQQIDEIIVSAMANGELGDVPKVVPRHSTKAKDAVTNAPVSPVTDPMGALGVAFKDLITWEGFRKGATESMKGNVISVTDIRKAVKGNTLEERLGTANGIALSILGDMITDPFIVASLPRQVVQGVANKIAKGQVKKAYKVLAGIMDGKKYADEAQRIKLFKRFKKKGIQKKFNLLQDSLEGAKKRSGKGLIVSPERSLKGPTITTPALREADLTGKGLRKALPPGRQGTISTAAPSGKAIPLDVEAGNRMVERINKAIPVGAVSEKGVHKIAQAEEKARLSKKAIKEGPKRKELAGQVDQKALPEGRGAGTPVHKPTRKLGSGGEITTKLRKSPENMQKMAGKRFKVDGIMKLDDDMRAAGYTEDMVQVTHAATNGSETIPMSKFTRRGLKTLDERMRRRFKIVKKKGTKIKPIDPKKTGKGGIIELGAGKVLGKSVDELTAIAKKAGAETKGIDDTGKVKRLWVHEPRSGSTGSLPLEEVTEANVKKWLDDTYKGYIKGQNERYKSKGFELLEAKGGKEHIKHIDSGKSKWVDQEDLMLHESDVLKSITEKIKPLTQIGDKPPITIGSGKIIRGKFGKGKELEIDKGGDLLGIDPVTGKVTPTERGLREGLKPGQGQVLSKEQIEKSLSRTRNMDDRMRKKGYKYRVDLPEGMGESMYSRDFNAAKEMAKEYGKGTKVVDLHKAQLRTIKGGKKITQPGKVATSEVTNDGIIISKNEMSKYEQEAMERLVKAKPAQKIPKDSVKKTKKAYEEVVEENNLVNNPPIPEDPNGPRRGGGGGGQVLPSFLGGLQTWFENRAGQRLVGDGLARWNKAPFSVVKPWNEIGFEKTGIAIKNVYSKSEAVAEQGTKEMKTMSKIAQTGRHNIGAEKFAIVDGKPVSLKYTDDDLAEVALLANNQERWNALSKADKVKFKEGVKHVRKFFAWAKDEYRKLGANIDFKQRMIDIHSEQIGALKKIADDLKKTPLQGYDRAILKDLGFEVKGLPKELNRKQIATFLRENLDNNVEIIKRLEKMEFVHIPYDMWFNTGKINKAATLKALKIANAQKRQTILIEDLIQAGAINKGDINIFDIMASYTHRMSKDIAMLNLKKIAMGEGLLSKEAIPGFKKLPVFQAPMFHDVHMHPAFVDWMMDFKFQSFNVDMLDKVFSMTKMWQFAKPLFLPYYDLAQAVAARAFSNPLTVPRDVRMAWKMMREKGPDYFEAMGYGLPSRPIDVPWDQFTDTLNKLKGTTMGDYMAAQVKNKNWTVVKPVYNALWETAWTGDRFIRLTTYNYFVNTLKMPKVEAAQLAALFHSDYANVPIAMRRRLNKIFFTPTFKITMFRLYKEMGKAMLQVPLKKAAGKTLTTQEKQLAKGGVATTVGLMYGFDWIMQNAMGYERDQFARRYYKRVEDPDNPGMMKDHVVVFSNPMTMIPKYYYKADKMLSGLGSDDKLKTVFDTMRWEIHPIGRIGYEAISNIKANGDPISIPYNDDDGVGVLRRLLYAGKETFKVLETIPAFKEEENVEAYDKWKKEAGFLWSTLNSPATFAYYRSPKVRSMIFNLKARKAELKSTMRRMEREDKLTPEMEQRMMKNYFRHLEDDLKKFDDALADYDKSVQGEWLRERRELKRKEKAAQDRKKKSIKQPTPFISVPGYTPPPGA